MTKHKIGVVGGSGYIGFALAKYLSKSFQVKVVDKNPLPEKVQGRIIFERCDIREFNEVKNSLSDVDLVIHAAIVQIPLINEAKRLGYEVNVLGTQNLCKVADKNPRIKGLILIGSWHVFGESGLKGVINEEFGFRPDRVQERARLYALCKIAQETVVRVHDEFSEKVFGLVRLGTVLGDKMPEKTAANLFIFKGLRGEAITPYKDSMYRPMLYIDIGDVQKGVELYAKKILNGETCNETNSLHHIVNLCWPEPVTIFELAEMVRDLVIKCSNGKIKPEIKVVDTGQSSFFVAGDKKLMKVDITKAKGFLGLKNLVSPNMSLERVIRKRISKMNLVENDSNKT
jgi:nucleoside-diphosphate-sugar epimerase